MISEKVEEVKKLHQLLYDYPVIGILNMHSLPARQLQKIRDRLRGKAVIRMGKKNLLTRALGDNKIIEKITGEPAIILSKENPFTMFKILKENRAPSSAKAGQIAANDIIVPKGPTPLTPGPAISTLQKLKLKTRVEAGRIAIASDTVVCRAGEAITEEMVAVFSLLKIEPMEVGLDMVAASDQGIIYDKEVLDINVDEYLGNITRSVQQASCLALEIGFLSPDTAPMAIQKAFLEAKALAMKANIMSPDIIDDLLVKAISEAKALEDSIVIKEGIPDKKVEKEEFAKKTEPTGKKGPEDA